MTYEISVVTVECLPD